MTATLLLALLGTAWAGPFEEELSATRDALVAKDTSGAGKHLGAAESAARDLAYPGKPALIARAPYYRGLIEHLGGDKKGRAMDYWRDALVIDNGLEWDKGILADVAAQDLFEALRREVRQRGKVDPLVPEMTGAAKIYVDGVRLDAGDPVFEGLHLAQVECPDGDVHGVWTTFNRPVKWFKMCPGGVDTAVVVAEAAPADDWSDFGPSFDDTAEGPPEEPVLATEPAVEPKPAEKPKPAVKPAGVPKPAETTTVVTTTPTEPAATPLDTGSGPPEMIRRKVSWPLLVGAGGAAVLSGTLYGVALKHRGQFDDLDNPDLGSAAEVNALAKKTNTEVYASAGLGVLATGLYVAAFVQW